MSSEWADKVPVPSGHTTPGPTLAAQREAMGWSVEQVADQLKLAVRQVIALEAGDYASLPGPAVVRGFVRAYAKIVKLDPVPLVSMIAIEGDASTGNGAVPRRDNKPASFSEVRFPSNGKRKASPLLPIVGVVVLLGAAAAGAWHFGLIPGGFGRAGAAAGAASVPAPGIAGAPNSAVTALPPPPALASVPSGSPAAGGVSAPLTSVPLSTLPESRATQSTSVPLISVPPVGTASGPGAAGVSATAPAAAATGVAAAPAATGANTLVVTVREDAWIEVRPAKGAPLIARLVKAGSTETFELKQPVSLIVGKPGAVSVSLRGAAVELPPVPGKAFSRVNLK